MGRGILGHFISLSVRRDFEHLNSVGASTDY
ncbi:hypothetical protein T09_3395 [Trichinella sp. T9]|nr:hypothetical protein T09_3395 [Trichinella sp. T9]